MKSSDKLSQVLSFCRRRGFLFPSSEIYGGLNSCFDFGPLGVLLKNNIKKLWWEEMTKRDNVVGLDSSIFMHPKVWEASGHLEGFTDPLRDCKSCKQRFKDEECCKECPSCGSKELTPIRNFNLMFETSIGPVKEEGSQVFLRPETAQGIYVNFLNIQQSQRLKLPFGVAQIGKAFRNEITPSHSIFRTREFEQMEMQFFVEPSEADKWFEYWREERKRWLLSLGFKEDELHFKAHSKEELAHYAKKAEDIEFDFPMGRRELEGLHNRGDFDLTRHEEFSKKKLRYFDSEKNKSYLPYIIESSSGCDRLFLALLSSALTEEKLKDETRMVLKISPRLSPIQVAILPLSKKEELISLSNKVSKDLKEDFFTELDLSGSIGKRYRRQDEIGTPLCVTLDFESLEDEKATVRFRDDMTQERVALSSLKEFLGKALKA